MSVLPLSHAAAAAVAECINQDLEHISLLSSLPTHLAGYICLHLKPEALEQFLKSCNGLVALCEKYLNHDSQLIILATARQAALQPMYKTNDVEQYFKDEVSHIYSKLRFQTPLNLAFASLGFHDRQLPNYLWKLMPVENDNRMKMRCFLDPTNAVYSCYRTYTPSVFPLPLVAADLLKIASKSQSHFTCVLGTETAKREFYIASPQDTFAATLAKAQAAHFLGKVQISLFLTMTCLFNIPTFHIVSLRRHLILTALHWFAFNAARLYVKPEITRHSLNYAKQFFCFPFDEMFHLIVEQKVELYYGNYKRVWLLHKRLEHCKLPFDSIWFKQEWTNYISSVFLYSENTILQLITDQYFHLHCPSACNSNNVKNILRQSFKVLENLSKDVTLTCALLPYDSSLKTFFELQQIYIEMYVGLLRTFELPRDWKNLELLRVRRQLSVYNSIYPTDQVRVIQRLIYVVTESVSNYYLDEAIEEFFKLFSKFDEKAGFFNSASTSFSCFTALVIIGALEFIDNVLQNKAIESLHSLTHGRHPRLILLQNLASIYPDKIFHAELLEMNSNEPGNIFLKTPTSIPESPTNSCLDQLEIRHLLHQYISLDSEIFCDSLSFGYEMAKQQLNF